MTVKKRILALTYLFLAIIFFVLGILLQKNSFTSQPEQINIKKFETTLHEKEQITTQLIAQLAEKLKMHNFKSLNNVIFFEPDSFSVLKKQDIYFLVYDFDTLKYWTDNHIDIPFILDNRFNLRVNKIGNTWYEIFTQKYGEYTIIGLITIKEEYPYTNKYLRSHFEKDFDIPDNVKISIIPVSFGYDIKGFDQQYVFTLVPPNAPSKPHKNSKNPGVILLLISYLFLIAYLSLIIEKNNKITGAIIISLLVLLRLAMLIFRSPGIIYKLQLFSPIVPHYSVGDLFIDSFLAGIILIYITRKFKYSDIRPERTNIKFDVIAFSVINLFFIALLFGLYDLFYSFIIKSNISFEIFKITQLSISSFCAIISFGTALLMIFYSYYKSFVNFSKYLSSINLLIITLVIYALLLGINMAFGDINIPGKLWILFAISTLLYFSLRKKLSFSYLLIIIAIISTIVASNIIYSANNKKYDIQAKKVANKVKNLRDAVAEQLLKEMQPKLDSDVILKTYLNKSGTIFLEKKIKHYLEKEYFLGYWRKYNLKLTLCSNSLNLPSSQNRQNCANLYGELINKFGYRIANNLEYINKTDGTVVYLLKISGTNNDLYIELSPKVMPKKIGYPELLLDTIIQNPIPKNFSYAKYKNLKLIFKSGTFEYPSYGKIFGSHLDSYVKLQGYKHYIKKLDTNENFIVVSYKTVNFYNLLITFAYLFFFLVIIELIIVIINAFTTSNHKLKSWTIQNKLIFAMISVLTIAFLSLGTATVIFNIAKFKRQFEDQIKNKLHSAAIALESDYSTDTVTTFKKIRFISQILNVDINLYNRQGQLIATSRKKIFENKLLSHFINHDALYKLLVLQQNDFINLEKIGLLTFKSGYTKLKSPSTGTIGIINIPFFTNPNQLHEQISNLIITLTNIYIILFILTIAIAILISEQVIAPIKTIQQKFQKLKIGHKYEKIDYYKNDEIGQLITEYNNMVDKLEQSINLLAKNERESAWREMAKQIAHEIKNPLTPMKLSIQLLQRAWDNKDTNFGQRLKDVTQTLIEQIENLRNIAEEFSAFAKMPVSNNEVIDLAQKIENLMKLYENLDNVEVKAIIKKRPVKIWADNKQISRVFINLIKNAIQAIPEGVKGKVIVELDVIDDKALVKIIDNGTGIPEEIRDKLFIPSFTTKSSGMGLGLAMVKNIIQNAGGKIWFETKVGEGTTFFVEFPLYKNEEAQAN